MSTTRSSTTPTAKTSQGEKKPEVPAQAPGQIGPFAVPKSVEDAAKKPEGKPAATGDVGGDLRDLLGANDPATAGAEPKPTAAPQIRPQDVEQFKTQARNLLRQHGVPPDQIEAQVNAMVADAQKTNTALADSAAHTPANPDTTPGPAPADTRSLGEKLGDKFNNFVNEAHDQFYNRLDSTAETLQNLTGTGGEGRPGVLESWQQLGEAAVENHMKDPLHLRDPMGPLGPWGAVNGVVDDIPEMIDNPGKHAGDVLFDATAMAATAPLGAEGLLGKSMLPEVGALERGLVSEGGRTLEHGAAPAVPHTPTRPQRLAPQKPLPSRTAPSRSLPTPRSRLPFTTVRGHHQSDTMRMHHLRPIRLTHRQRGRYPPHGEPGSFGYDENGDRLRYANGRRDSGLGRNRVWNDSRDGSASADRWRPGRPSAARPGPAIGRAHRTVRSATTGLSRRAIDSSSDSPATYPRDGLWDMGHGNSHQYRDLRQAYLSGEISFKDLREFRDPDDYLVQDPYRNRSHIDEQR
ncbi:GH-E family nuclease [Mycobacterium sp. 134]|uniref:GH-E family nuclease n=1 Tax=Mycobacterium sp. 134 TaxID=3400425 RepID=UPI003AACB99C